MSAAAATEAPTRLRKEKLRDELSTLTECEHEQVYRIIRAHTDQLTCAESGVYVSADVLSPKCFTEIEQYIRFCVAQKHRLDSDEAKRQALFKMVHSEE